MPMNFIMVYPAASSRGFGLKAIGRDEVMSSIQAWRKNPRTSEDYLANLHRFLDTAGPGEHMGFFDDYELIAIS